MTTSGVVTDRAGGVGYTDRRYAASFSQFGQPYHLTGAKGWILERSIPGTHYRDGMGCYPLFACQNATALTADVGQLGSRLVSLSLVADPLGGFSLTDLKEWFPDVCTPFKEHYVIHWVKQAASTPCIGAGRG